jgi:glyoxylase-like metal-dependent hydrolase (beta-lactamase superfamily II)/rhodanese-related sulfurtransferase
MTETITETMMEMQTAQAMTAADLYESLLRGDAPLILDMRNPTDFARWHVEGRSTLDVRNIPYNDFLTDADAAIATLPQDREVLVVCAKGISAQYIAVLLRERGITARYLEGGIQCWGNHYDTRTIASVAWGRIMQIARPARGDLSFMLVSNGEAALIDPLRHTQHYIQAIAQAGARLTHIFDTHVHADHISGGPALSQASGAPYSIHPYDAIHPIDMLPAKIAYTPLVDGQVFQVGHLTITVIWYPGHTLGQVNFLVEAPDGARFLFTGDGIFLRSFGRPDLGGKGEAWTPMLYDSMVRRLPPHLTDATMILPAHFSSLDECDLHGVCAAPWSTVQQANTSLSQLTSATGFADFVLSNLPVFPPQYVEIKRVNIGLSHPSEEQAEALELGKNICALSK